MELYGASSCPGPQFSRSSWLWVHLCLPGSVASVWAQPDWQVREGRGSREWARPLLWASDMGVWLGALQHWEMGQQS